MVIALDHRYKNSRLPLHYTHLGYRILIWMCKVLCYSQCSLEFVLTAVPEKNRPSFSLLLGIFFY